jgi:CubicO group peptidase (beta-lactamase class C family)
VLAAADETDPVSGNSRAGVFSTGPTNSTRDLARFGLLYLNEGVWAGNQAVPSSWVKDSTKRWSDASWGMGYGYMWWELPSDLGLGGAGFAALGFRGQAVAVIPSKRLVVAQTADPARQPR